MTRTPVLEASPAATVLKGGTRARRPCGSAASRRPAVHAQEPKVLRYLGTAVNQSTEIAKKVKEDTGITIEYIPVTTDDVAKRIVTQPNSFDIVDEEYFSLKKVIPSGNLLGMDAKRIKYADKITPIFTKGAAAERQEDRRPGHRAEEGVLSRRRRTRRSSPPRRRNGSR